MKNYFTILFFILFSYEAFGQVHDTTYSIHALVIDSLSNKPLPFASVHILGSRNGTISNFHGEVELKSVQVGDTINCSFIGYEKKSIIAESAIYLDTIYLNRSAQLIDEVMVLADDAILYKLLLQSKKTQSSQARTSKTYFQLESFNEDRQLEIFQAYYNGNYSGYEVQSLFLKNGRSWLSPTAKSYFASVSTSKVMCMHKSFDESNYFATNPLELNRRKLFKFYDLTLSSKYKDQDNRTVYQINCNPKIKNENYFETRVWIDSASNNLLKVSFKIKNAQIHPFQLISLENNTIGNISLEITKTFHEIENNMYPEAIDFSYSMTIKTKDDSTFTNTTRAILYAYDYMDEFELPRFIDDENHYSSDYNRIQAIPYNDLFWKCTNEFTIKNSNVHENTFIKDSSSVASTDIEVNQISNRPAYTLYLGWSMNRINLIQQEEVKQPNERGSIAALQYHLNAVIYLDINELCDSLHYATITVLDTYNSYYHLPKTDQSLAFINIYYDLMEIQRRRLNEQLDRCENREQMNRAYEEVVAESNAVSEKYFKEVQRGANGVSFIKWNDIVIKELGIDNISIFGLTNGTEE